jgi:hypothetical protein
MRDPVTGVLLAVAMIAVVVGVDLLFFRGERWFWQRLAANIGIVLFSRPSTSTACYGTKG